MIDTAGAPAVLIENEADLVKARRVVREVSIAEGFTLVDQTRLITAVSELTRNAFSYAGTGVMRVEKLEGGNKRGLRVTVTDDGPGIADVHLALTDGYTTSGGLGKGLGGSRRLVDEFDISSSPGNGTRVSIVKWHS